MTGSATNDHAGRRWRYVAVSALVAFLLVFFLAWQTNAQSLASDAALSLVNWIIALFTKVLVYIMELLGYILIQLVDILIQIVQFNNFVNASPVRIGWPLMRDTVNMFFIIVVLVSAFSTIIGYQEFHYRKILPKLLMMAILINFSKTLIGLMIDFSQVVVLTFVNGFKAAAGGNFINALHITEAMNIESQGQVITQDSSGVHVSMSNSTSVSVYQIFNMMLAAIFGIWMLSIAVTLVIIMLIFFLARIIILWFLLITSPVMFFAWSLPAKMQKAFAAFTDQWWNRLSSALIGGPVMAFFLWLSLAIAQGANGPDALTGSSSTSALYKNQSAESQNVVSSLGGEQQLGSIVVTKIGKPENFANFIIMVAFMLLGVQMAVQSSQALAPKLGALAGSVAGAGGAAGAGVALVAAGARATERGARWAGGKVEERFGIKAGLAQKTLGLAQKTGIPMTMGMRTALATAATAPQRAAVKRAAELKTAMGFLPPSMQMKEWENLATSRVAKRADRIAGMQNMASLAKSATFMKDQQKVEREAIVARDFGKGAKYDKLTTEQKLAVDTEARKKVDSMVAQKLQMGSEFAVANNMTELMDEVKKAREENPALFADIKDIDSVAAKMASDPEAERKMKDDSFMNMAFTLQYLKGRGFMNDNGDLTVDPTYDKDFQKLLRGRQGQLIASTLDYIGTEEGRKNAQTILQSKDNKERAKVNMTINSSNDGKTYSVAAPPAREGAAPTIKTYTMGGFATSRDDIVAGVNAANVSAVEAELSRRGLNLQNIGRRLGNDARATELANNLRVLNDPTATTGNRIAAQMEIMQKGLMDAKGLFGMSDDGTFRDTGPVTAAQNEAAYNEMVSSAYRNVSRGYKSEINMRVIANSLANTKGAALSAHGKALSSLTDRPGGRNIGYEALRKAMDTATGEQARLFKEGVREIMNEAATAVRAQAAGQALSAAQQSQIANSEWLRGSKATTNEEKGTTRRLRAYLSGSETISLTA